MTKKHYNKKQEKALDDSAKDLEESIDDYFKNLSKPKERKICLKVISWLKILLQEAKELEPNQNPDPIINKFLHLYYSKLPKILMKYGNVETDTGTDLEFADMYTDNILTVKLAKSDIKTYKNNSTIHYTKHARHDLNSLAKDHKYVVDHEHDKRLSPNSDGDSLIDMTTTTNFTVPSRMDVLKMILGMIESLQIVIGYDNDYNGSPLINKNKLQDAKKQLIKERHQFHIDFKDDLSNIKRTEKYITKRMKIMQNQQQYIVLLAYNPLVKEFTVLDQNDLSFKEVSCQNILNSDHFHFSGKQAMKLKYKINKNKLTHCSILKLSTFWGNFDNGNYFSID